VGGYFGQSPFPSASSSGSLIGGDSKYQSFNYYDSVTAVPAGAETVVIQRTVLPSTAMVLANVQFSGTNIATYRLYIDSDIIGTHVTWHDGNISDSMSFALDQLAGLRINAGQTLKLTAQHGRPFIGDFTGRFLGVIIII
jgi:hypothetical protein